MASLDDDFLGSLDPDIVKILDFYEKNKDRETVPGSEIVEFARSLSNKELACDFLRELDDEVSDVSQMPLTDVQEKVYTSKQSSKKKQKKNK